MLRLQSTALLNVRRTLRAQYANWNAWPAACTFNTVTSFLASPSGGMLALGNPAGQAAVFPGCPMQVSPNGGSDVTLCVGSSTSGSVGGVHVLGLSANYVGGTMDDLHGNTQIGVWRGRGGTFEVLAPVFATEVAGANTVDNSTNSAATNALLGANTTGQLDSHDDSAVVTSTNAIARVLDNLSGSSNATIIELLVP